MFLLSKVHKSYELLVLEEKTGICFRFSEAFVLVESVLECLNKRIFFYW